MLIFTIWIDEKFPNREIPIVGSFAIQKWYLEMPEQCFDWHRYDWLIKSPNLFIVPREVESYFSYYLWLFHAKNYWH